MFTLTIANNIISTLFLWCTLSLPLQAEAPTTPSSLPQASEHMDYEHLIPSKQEIKQYIDEGTALAAIYTDPTFLYPIIHADQIRMDKQQVFNHTVLHKVQISHMPPLAVGLYNKDVLIGTYLSVAWALEWFFFYKLQQLIVASKTNLLLQQAQAINAILTAEGDPATRQASLNALLQQHAIVWHPLQNAKLIGCIAAYVTAQRVLQSYQRWWLLHEQHTLTPGAPLPLTSLVPDKVTSIMLSATPTGLLAAITDFFDYYGFMPLWTKRTSWLLTRDMGALLGWLWWQEKRIVNPLMSAMLVENPMLLGQQKLLPEDIAKLQTAIQASLKLSFKTWFYLKTLYVGVGYTIIDGATALGGAINTSTWGYNFYKELNAKNN